MDEFLEEIKLIALGILNNANLTNIFTATMTGPRSIKISDSLSADNVTLPKHLTDYEVVIEIDGISRNCVVKNKLSVGDKVMVVRENQQYFIIDRVG